MKRKLKVTGAVAILGMALFAGGALLPRSLPATEAASPVADLAPTDIKIDTQNVDSAIAALRERVAAGGPRLSADQASLAFAYLQKARAEADPVFYDKAEEALSESLRIQPADNLRATLGRAILAGSRHDFRGQLRWAERALDISPFHAEAHGIAGDAELELGLVQKGIASYQRMVDIRPDLSSLGRISYAADTLGNTRGAIAAMKRALGFAGTSKENAAWAHWQLGELYIGANDLERAGDHLDKALALVPDFGGAIESTAHLAAATGDIARAVEILSGLVEDVPLPGNFTILGELLLIQGRDSAAHKAFAEADRRLGLYGEHGVRPDVDFVTFWVDRDIHLERALKVARTLYGQRKSAAVSDALAWALYAHERFEEARTFAMEALRRSPGDSGYLYHLAMIDTALGNADRATDAFERALRADPSWSIIESHTARQVLGDQGHHGHAASTGARSREDT